MECAGEMLCGCQGQATKGDMDSSQLSPAAGISPGTTCKSGCPAHLCPTCPCESGPLGRRIKWELRGGSPSGSSACQVLSSWASRHMREACVLRACLVILKVLHLVIMGCVLRIHYQYISSLSEHYRAYLYQPSYLGCHEAIESYGSTTKHVACTRPKCIMQ